MAKTSIKVELLGDSRSVERAFKKTGEAGQDMGRKLTGLGKTAAIGLAGLGVAAAAAGGKMVSMASDAAEVQSKMQVTFGRTLPGLTKNLDAFSKATGTSRFELREQAADMGALLVPLTSSKQAAADMSEQFVKLATDLGSFNNVPTADALLAIRSGLVGEAEPLRRFGVLLNEAAVKQEGLRLGLVKGKQEMTEQQKVQARASLIMQQTTLAQGDATRTAGSMANQMKRLRSSIKDAATTGGQMLIPFALKAVTAFNSAFGAVGAFVDKLGKADSIKAKLNVVWDFGQGIFESIKKALVGGFENQPVMPGHHLVRVFKPGLQQAVAEGIAAVDWGAAWGKASGIAEGLATRFKTVNWTSVGKAMGDGIADGVGAASELGQKLAAAVNEAARSINWQQLGRAMGPGLATAIVTAFATLTDVGFWTRNWDLALAVALVAFSGPLLRLGGKLVAPLGRLGGDLVLGIVSGIERRSPRLGAALLAGLLKLPGIASGALAKLASTVGGIFPKLTSLAKFTVKVIGVEAIINGVVDMSKKVLGKFSQLPGGIQTALGDLSGTLFSAGYAILQGFFDGIKQKWEDIKNFILAIPRWIQEHKGPPSKDAQLLVEAGRLIMYGLQVGMERGWAPLEAWLDGRGAKLSDAMKGLAQNVLDKAGMYRSAWDKFTEQALAAFDDMTSKLRTMHERVLDMLAGKSFVLDVKQAKHDVGTTGEELDKAKLAARTAAVLGDPDAIKAAAAKLFDAQMAYDRAVLSLQQLQAQRLAEQERKKQDEEDAVNRARLETKLANMTVAQQKVMLQEGKGQIKIVKLIKSYDSDYQKAGAKLGQAFADGLASAAGAVQKAAQKLADAANAFNTAAGAKGRAASDAAKQGKPLPGFATGGKFQANRPFLVGEAGKPEIVWPNYAGAVLPITTGGGSGSTLSMGGGTTVVINNHFPHYVGDKRDLEQAMEEIVYRKGRLNSGGAFGGFA